MIYLSGCTSPSYEQDIIGLGVGLLIQPRSYAPKRVGPFPRWAADNGCYPPDENWESRHWLTMLTKMVTLSDEVKARGLFLLVPDMPFDHEATLRRFFQHRHLAARLGVPLAFAIQDGATVDTVPWDDFDVVFLAGSTEWKMGEEACNFAIHARNRGKWVHMGRVNSWDRLDWASRIGCDSADGTFLKHGKPEDMVARMKVWLDNNAPRLTQKGAVA